MTSCPLVFTATGQLIPTSKLYNAFRKPTKQAFLSLLSSSPSFVGNYYSLIVIYTKHSSVCVCVTGRKEKTSSSDHIKCMCQLLGYSPPPILKQLLSCSKSWYFSGWFGVCFGLFFFLNSKVVLSKQNIPQNFLLEVITTMEGSMLLHTLVPISSFVHSPSFANISAKIGINSMY